MAGQSGSVPPSGGVLRAILRVAGRRDLRRVGRGWTLATHTLTLDNSLDINLFFFIYTYR
jgi:hypothetical protein